MKPSAHPFADILDVKTQNCPFALYERMRAEAPVCRIPQPAAGRDTFFVTSHALVEAALKDAERFSNDVTVLLNEGAGHNPAAEEIMKDGWVDYGLLATTDDPAHRHFRRMLRSYFTPGSISEMHGSVRRIVDELIDGFVDKGECDFVNDFAIHLPTYVMADLMALDRGLYDFIRAGSDAALLRVGQMATPEEEVEAARVTVAFQRFLMDRVHERQEVPGDDLISRIVQARAEDGTVLTDVQARAFVQEVLVAGNETTRSALISGLALFVANPDALAQVRADPALIPNAVEEIIRLETPSTSIWRIATVDTELGGVAIPAGSVINLRFDAANRDGAVFSCPDRFEPGRRESKQHLGFGSGIHTCLGNALARAELVIAFERLFARLCNIRIDQARSDLGHKPSLLLRVKRALYIKFDKI